MEEVSQQQQSSEYNVLSIIGFIFAFVFPPVGFILGIIALSHIKKTNEKGRGLAIAAIVLGAIFFLFLILMMVVGFAWIAIRNTVQTDDNVYGGEMQLSLNVLCLNTEVRATEITNSTPSVFDVTLKRSPGQGEQDIGGVMLVFVNADQGANYVYTAQGNLVPLADTVVSVTLPEKTMPNPNEVSVVVYFLDESGNKQLCDTATQLKFDFLSG
jgi:hypothetical protein